MKIIGRNNLYKISTITKSFLFTSKALFGIKLIFVKFKFAFVKLLKFLCPGKKLLDKLNGNTF